MEKCNNNDRIYKEVIQEMYPVSLLFVVGYFLLCLWIRVCQNVCLTV